MSTVDFDKHGNWTLRLVYTGEEKITPELAITRERSVLLAGCQLDIQQELLGRLLTEDQSDRILPATL